MVMRVGKGGLSGLEPDSPIKSQAILMISPEALYWII